MRPMTTRIRLDRRRAGTSAAALAAAAIAVTALAPAAQARARRTPLTTTVLTAPAPVMGTDGRRHVPYELTLVNGESERSDVQSVTVRAKDGRVLLRLAGARLAAVTWDFARRPTTSFGAAQGGHVWIDVALPRRAAVPHALVHRIRVHSTFANGGSVTSAWDGARTRVSTRAPVALAPPLRGGRYMDFNGCCDLSAHRSAIAAMDGRDHLSQRYAADFIKVDRHGAGARGDLSRNASFFTFGEPVLAVADARVVSTLNTVGENVPFIEPPGSAFTERSIVGNQVVLALGHGRYAVYGHLKTGSVRVHKGQRVHRGQVIGLVGNTGQSGGAHLHLQVSDGPDPLASEGLPFVFRRFRLAGTVVNLDRFLMGAANADIRARHAGRRHGQMPLQDAVVRFAR